MKTLTSKNKFAPINILKPYLKALFHVSAFLFLLSLVLAALSFPYDTDAPLTQQEIAAVKKYYADAYAKPANNSAARSEYDTRYLEAAEAEAEHYKIEEQIQAFVNRFNLKTAPVLEIGAGRGYLQDISDNYTGLDISSSVARFYHKKFVLGSATALPFADNSFAGIWSIWVLEHVQNPEQAFLEIRRVIRNKGVIFLLAAWDAPSWAAEGYAVRPYSDFGLGGKLIKVSIPVRQSPPFLFLSSLPNRLIRSAVAKFGPTRLLYHRLMPNYDQYWQQDSDAVNSIDIYETLLWFTSRGDECLNCERAPVFMGNEALIIRVNKG